MPLSRNGAAKLLLSFDLQSILIQVVILIEVALFINSCKKCNSIAVGMC